MFPLNGRAIKFRCTFYLLMSQTCNGSPLATENDDTNVPHLSRPPDKIKKTKQTKKPKPK